MSKPIDLKVFNPYKVEGLKRIGSGNDGGYAVHLPSLQLTDCLINYGVGYDVSFEKEYNKITGNPVYSFDPTMNKSALLIDKIKNGEYKNAAKQLISMLQWFSQEKDLKKHQIHFIEEGLSAGDKELFKSFSYHLSKYNLLDKKIFLKIDIEGAELEVMSEDSFYTNINNVIQLIVEFHYAGKYLEKIAEIINKLSGTHSLIHIHGNNIGPTFNYEGKQIPEVFEVTFLLSSFLSKKTLSAADYPIEGLDFACNKKKADIQLNFFK